MTQLLDPIHLKSLRPHHSKELFPCLNVLTCGNRNSLREHVD